LDLGRCSKSNSDDLSRTISGCNFADYSGKITVKKSFFDVFLALLADFLAQKCIFFDFFATFLRGAGLARAKKQGRI